MKRPALTVEAIVRDMRIQAKRYRDSAERERVDNPGLAKQFEFAALVLDFLADYYGHGQVANEEVWDKP